MGQIRRIGLVVAAVWMAGCGDEAPTEVGSELLGEELRTVRTVLDASEFLQADTVFDGIGSLNQVPYRVVANAYGGEVDAYMLFQVARPALVSYDDADGNSVTDSIASIQGATLSMIVDSLTLAEGDIAFEVLELTESWNPATATWELRFDTAGVSEAWTTPGGPTGELLATGAWSEGDTLSITFDSAAAAILDDPENEFEGAALRISTPDKRMRFRSVDFRYDIVPFGADTILTTGRIEGSVSVAPPPQPAPAGVLRVGGLPVWRSFVQFRRLADLPVPCEAGSTTCQVPLSEVTVNTANLLVWTVAAGGQRAEGGMRVEGRAVLEGPTVPLTRSPLSAAFGSMQDTLAVEDFASPAGVMARVPITRFVRRNAIVAEDEDAVLWLALTAVGERSLFGYGAFGALNSATPPQLELVVTIPIREVNP